MAYLASQGLSEKDVNPDFDMAATRNIRGMLPAVELFRSTVAAGGKVGLVGDYDVDGIAGTAGPYLAFKEAGVQCKVHIPNRELGFGLQIDAVEKMHAHGMELIITIDNGTAAIAAVQRAKDLGMKVIVLDHHPARDWSEVAPADVIVNVSHPESDPQYIMMSGAAVAYAFLYNCVAEGVIKLDDVERYSAFAAFGIIADVVDLRGINRPLVSLGLSRCREFVGFNALAALQGKWIGDVPKAQEVAFQLAPRLNAAGRLGDAKDAYRLLITQDVAEATALASALDKLNADRQTKVNLAMKEADKMVAGLDDSWETITLWGPAEDEYVEDPETGIKTLVRAGWTHGIVGLIAGKIAERYARPTFIGSQEADGKVRGSARAGGGVPCGPLLVAAAKAAEDAAEAAGLDKEAEENKLFSKFGGHNDAAGFTTTVSKMNTVAGALHHAAQDHLLTATADRKGHVIRVDALWPLPYQSELGELQKLEPTGQGLRPATITSQGVRIFKYNWTGKVLRLAVTDERMTNPRDMMAFRELPLHEGDLADLTYEVAPDGSLMIRDVSNIQRSEPDMLML
jgi:single-stranded-DNA-specific exonuclease